MNVKKTKRWIKRNISKQNINNITVCGDGSIINVESALLLSDHNFNDIHSEIPFDIKESHYKYMVTDEQRVTISNSVFRKLPKLPKQVCCLEMSRCKIKDISSIFDSHIDKIYYNDPDITKNLETYSSITGCEIIYTKIKEVSKLKKYSTIIVGIVAAMINLNGIVNLSLDSQSIGSFLFKFGLYILLIGCYYINLKSALFWSKQYYEV